MNETVREWVAKAEADCATARRELAADNSNLDAVCFHAQQCVEKLMKAVLINRGVIPTRSHHLPQLGQAVAEACPGFAWRIEELRFLTQGAVLFRYPGEQAEPADAAQAFEIATRLRDRLRALFQG